MFIHRLTHIPWRAVIALAAVLTMTAATGCIHQYGREVESPWGDATVEVKVVRDLRWRCDNPAITILSEDDGPVRYTVALCRAGERIPLQSRVIVEADGGDALVRFEAIGRGDYEIWGWCEHCTPAGAAVYYDSGNLREITMLESAARLDNPLKEAFGGSVKFHTSDVADSAGPVELTLGRVHGAYCLVAENAGEEIVRGAAEGTVTARVTYGGFVPAAFDLFRDTPVDASAFAPQSCSVTILPGGGVMLASDLLLTPAAGRTGVCVNADIVDAAGRRIASTGYVDTEVWRGVVSVVGVTLSAGVASGGVTVNPGFSGDYNIFIP